MKVKRESEVTQSCPTLSDPMHCSLPGFSIHGIFQARVLEWDAIAFSNLGPRLHIMQISVLKEKLRFIGDVLTTLVSLVDTAMKPDFVNGVSFNKLSGGE